MDETKHISILLLIVVFLCALYSFTNSYIKEGLSNITNTDVEIVQNGQSINLLDVVQASQIKQMSDGLTEKITYLTDLNNILDSYQINMTTEGIPYKPDEDNAYRATIEGEFPNQTIHLYLPQGQPGLAGPPGSKGEKGDKGSRGEIGAIGNRGYFIG
jgi:hypothetical protein